MHALVRTSKPRCHHTITLFWVQQTFLDIQITLSTTTNSASTVSTVAACLLLRPAEALSAIGGLRSATAIMRQHTQARHHFATWYSYRTRTSRVRAIVSQSLATTRIQTRDGIISLFRTVRVSAGDGVSYSSYQ